MRMQTWPWGDEGEHSDDSDASETGDRRRSHFTAGESALGAGASSLANVDSMEIEPGSCLWRTVDAHDDDNASDSPDDSLSRSSPQCRRC